MPAETIRSEKRFGVFSLQYPEQDQAGRGADEGTVVQPLWMTVCCRTFAEGLSRGLTRLVFLYTCSGCRRRDQGGACSLRMMPWMIAMAAAGAEVKAQQNPARIQPESSPDSGLSADNPASDHLASDPASGLFADYPASDYPASGF